jgi:hypothetical protein
MIPTIDILLGRVIAHEHAEYEGLITNGRYLGKFEHISDLPTPSDAGNIAIVEETNTLWWYDDSLGYWVNTSATVPTYTKELKTLTSTEVTNATVYLHDTPNASWPVTFSIKNAGVNLNGLDFTVSGSTLSWRNTDLDGILEDDDEVLIEYYI